MGTVYIAIATLNQEAAASHYLFQGSREEIRQQTAHSAVQQLLESL